MTRPTLSPVLSVLLASALAALVLPLQAARPKYGAVETISAADLRSHLEFLASPQMRGRETPSEELDLAARYIAGHVARLGFAPSGSPGYLQAYPVVRERAIEAGSTLKVGERTFKAGPDFIAGAHRGRASGDLVYVGQGWSRRDSTAEPFGGLPVRGRIVVAHASPPRQPQDGKAEFEHKAWRSPRANAARAGALAVVFLPSTRQIQGWGRKEPGLETERVFVDGLPPEPGEEPVVPAIMASPGLVGVLFQGERIDPDEVLARELRQEPGEGFVFSPGKTIELVIETATDRIDASNVVTLLEGADPALRREYVVLSAHFDHVGVRGGGLTGTDGRFNRPAPDSVYVGADDNGSGSAALLEIAEAFARGPRPRRSVVIVWHSGEERGLWGSRWFTTHPTVPLARVVANLNADMIGRSRPPDAKEDAGLTGPREMYVIGSRRLSPALGDLIARVNGDYLGLTINYSLDAPNEPQNLYERSDHFIYAQKGIPAAFFFSGLHADYHQTSDTVDKIDYQKLEAIARTLHAITWTIAEGSLEPRSRADADSSTR